MKRERFTEWLIISILRGREVGTLRILLVDQLGLCNSPPSGFQPPVIVSNRPLRSTSWNIDQFELSTS